MDIKRQGGNLRLGITKEEFESFQARDVLDLPVADDIEDIQTVRLVVSGYTRERATAEFVTSSLLKVSFNPTEDNYDNLSLDISRENIQGSQDNPGISSIEVRRVRQDAMSE